LARESLPSFLIGFLLAFTSSGSQVTGVDRFHYHNAAADRGKGSKGGKGYVGKGKGRGDPRQGVVLNIYL
jgi:hypothetical protein